MLLHLAHKRSLDRLEWIDAEDRPNSKEEIDWDKTKNSVDRLSDRLGRAGFITPDARKIISYLPFLLISTAVMVALVFGYELQSRLKLLFLIAVMGYGGYLSYLLFLRWREREVRRKILFGLPIFLESVILIVESGVGLLPALSRVVRRQNGSAGIVSEIFGVVYQLTAAGVPFGRALEMVSEKIHNRTLQHVMLHLELSGVDGGELIPSLRSLSEHVHKEWQLSVEERVKRLENLVVFPVFISVIGLVLLTAAVPLVSVLGLRDKLHSVRSGGGFESSFDMSATSEE